MKIFTSYVILKLYLFCSTNTYFESENCQNIYLINALLICTNKFSMKSYRGLRTIQLQYIYSIQLSLLSNFSQDIVLWWEQALQKSSESESSVMVLGKCEWTTYMPYGGGRNNTDASKLLHRRFQQTRPRNPWHVGPIKVGLLSVNNQDETNQTNNE